MWLAGDSRDGRLQRALTHQLARHRHLRVHAGMLARPVECRMRQSWLRSDRFSQQWVRRYPCGEFVMEALQRNAEALARGELRAGPSASEMDACCRGRC